MDISKQYPNLPLDTENAAVFDVESLSSRLGLSTVDIIQSLRTLDRQTAETFSARSSTSPDEILRIFSAARQLFIEDLIPSISGLAQKSIATNLKSIDDVSGGIPLGTITEVFGASGCGKSQFLLSVAVNALKGDTENNTCICISTESPLESRRLDDFSKNVPNALDRISYIYCPDLENQDHILFTQLRVKLQQERESGKHTRAVIIDSVGHHLRAEDSPLNTSAVFRSHLAWQEEQLESVPNYHQEKARFDALTNQYLKGDSKFRNRTSKKYYLFTLYCHLAELARAYNVAIVMANQVSDVMDDSENGSSEKNYDDPLSFDFQVGPFSGWDSGAVDPFSSEYSTEQMPSGRSEADPREASARKRTASGAENGTQPEKVTCFEHRRYTGPKKKVPAMGYTWSKLMAHRILLWKSYQPAYEYTQEDSETEKKLESDSGNGRQDPASNSTLKNATQSAKLPILSGFHVRRFARLVSAHAPAATAEFEISQSGIREVAGAHVTQTWA